MDKLDRAIKDAEIRLKSIQANVSQLANEIAVLSPRKLELEQNIEFHKKAGTIPIANEHRKVRTELTKTKARLLNITAEHKRASQAIDEVIEIIEKFKRDQAALLKTSDDNVLRPAFGGKNGKK